MEALKRLFERTASRFSRSPSVGVLQFSEVYPDVFVGSCPATLADARRLRQGLGVTAVLNLQTDADFEHWNINWREMEDAYRALDIALVRVPITDFDSEDLKLHATAAAERLAQLLEVGHRVYLHCTAGRQRSPATAILYLATVRRMGLQAAAGHVQERHPCEPDVAALRELLDEKETADGIDHKPENREGDEE